MFQTYFFGVYCAELRNKVDDILAHNGDVRKPSQLRDDQTYMTQKKSHQSIFNENDDEYDSEIPQKLTQIQTNSTSKHALWVGLAFIVLGIAAIKKTTLNAAMFGRSSTSQDESQSFGYQFWSADRSKSSSTVSSGTTNNGDYYEFSDIYCVGETQMTSSSCAAQTAEQNNPVITSYEPFPVWTISDVEDILSDEAIENFAYFIFLLLDSLERCGKEVCNDAGSCTLDDDIWTETWIRKWDGMDFNAMWSVVDNEYCFCEDGKNSANCDACLCFGDESCCCYDGRNSTWANNTCAQDLLCTADNNCIAQNLESVQCAAHSQFLPCDTRTGSVVQICASGENPDCTKTNICPSNSWSGIKCGYQDLGIWNTGNWKCSGGGHSVSCIDEDTAGDILGGICTSGEIQNCDSHCKGYTGALCVSIDGVAIDYDNCEWLYEDSFGVFMECPDGYIATGICASGREQDCSENSHGMQCCKLSYRE